MTLYKLTDQDKKTRDDTFWGEGVTHTIPADRRMAELCTDGVLHAYKSLELGLLLNPIHAEIGSPLAWECEGEIAVEDWGKVGCYELTTTKQIPLPSWYVDEPMRRKVQVQFAILCARSVLDVYESKYPSPAPRKAIEAAEEYLKIGNASAAGAACDAARAASAACDAAYAAYAASAAGAAARAAYAASAASAARAAADAAARAAAYAAACAAARAAAGADARAAGFYELAKQAVSIVIGV